MAVTTLHTRAKSRNAAKPRKSKPLPPWFDAAVSFLKSLGLNTSQLAAVCEHLGLHLSATHVPILNGRDSAELQRLIDGSMPSASTTETPHEPDAYFASDRDWSEFRAVFDRVESPRRNAPSSATGSFRHPVRNRVVSDWTDADQLAHHHGCV